MATQIRVTNVREHEVLTYPLVLLEGVVEHAQALALPGELLFLDVRLDAMRWSFWPVAGASGRFKAFALLPAPGTYALTLRLTRGAAATNGGYPQVLIERTFTVEYAPRATRYVVRFYYQKCVDADGEGFDAPPGTDTSDAVAIDKIRFNALLMQTMTAEMFADAGLARQTFAIELAPDGLPFVRLLRSTFTNATARSIHDQELIRLVHEDIEAYGLDTHDALEFKHAVILGCSRYNPATQQAEGHTALGGDKVGVFGSCGLHTWPRHLGEVTAACLNNTRVDMHVLMDDSCYRGTHWANFATGIGAFLHELGHTFGLGHATTGIMGRGFDDMNRLLCAYEIDPHCGQPGFFAPAVPGVDDGRLALNLAAVREVTDRAGAHWNVSSARILHHCPWITGVPRASTHVPTVNWVRDACGPVGQGQYDGVQVPFASGAADTTVSPQSLGHTAELGAIVIDCDAFVHRIETFTRREVAHWDAQQWRAHGHKHLVVLLEGEFVTRVDVRAMAYVDGLQIHTNLRSSRWFGGFGGALEVLQPAPGCKIDRFFGTRGDNYVGTLGAHCSLLVAGSQTAVSPSVSAPTTAASPVPPSVPSQTVAGLGLSDGAQHSFSSQAPIVEAIAVTCDAFVESVRVLSSDEYARAVQEQHAPTFSACEHVFALVPGERIVRVEARSGHWVDCVRFVTTLRVSPWYGGDGGTDTIVLEAPMGYQVCGVFGTRGDSFVGTLGALFCVAEPLNAAGAMRQSGGSVAAAAVGAVPPGPPVLERFSTMHSPIVPLASQPARGPAIGVLVAIQDDYVTLVESFASAEAFDELTRRVYSMGDVDRVACFSLLPHELLLQVDVSFHALPSTDRDGRSTSVRVVDGVCFHTTTRCSSWFGAFRSSTALRFVVARDGHAIHDLASVFTHSTLTDIVGHECTVAAIAAVPRAAFSPDGRVRVDTGDAGMDVRVESRSALGIASVHLLKKNNGDHLNCFAWDWPEAAHRPRRWFLPQRMLLDKVEPLRDNVRASRPPTAAELLVREYIVGALDSGGGFSKAAAPPPSSSLPLH